MATALHSFDVIQIGKESSKGTRVAATRVLVGDGSFKEEQDFYRSAYPRALRANVGGLGVTLRKGMTLTFETELTAEEVIWPLATGIRGSVSPTTANGESTYVYTPQLTTYPTLDSATVEVIRGDGSTNHYYGEFGYALTQKFKIDWAYNQIAKLSWDMFGRARQSDTPTGALTVYSGREPLVSNLTTVFIDDVWANLGATQMNAIVRSASLEVVTGNEPDYTLDGRSDVDLTGHKVGILGAKLNLALEFDANGAAKSFTAFRANSGAFVRVKTTGSSVNGNSRYVQIDGAYRFVESPSLELDGEQRIVNLALESYYDETGTNTLVFTAMSGVSSLG